MLKLALRTLRFRWKGFIATFVVLFFGAAIVTGAGGIMESGIRLAANPQRLTAPVLVVHKQFTAEGRTLNNQILQKIHDTPQVATAIPDVSFKAVIVRNDTAVNDAAVSAGHAWSSSAITPYRLQAGKAPSTTNDVVINEQLAKQAGVNIGDSLQIAIQGQLQTFRLAGVVRALHNSVPVLFFSDQTAQEVRKTSGIDVIAVTPKAGVSSIELQKQLQHKLASNDVSVLAGEDRGIAEVPTLTRSSETLIVIAGPFGGLAVMIIIFVAGSTLSLLIRQRQREIALLRALGATPGQVRRMILGETFLIAVVAAAVAAYPARYFGEYLIRILADNDVVPSIIIFKLGIIPIITGIVATFLIAVVAALIASANATKIKPLEALSEASVPRRWFTPFKIVMAVLIAGGAIALSLITLLVMRGPVASSTGGPSAILWTAIIGLLVPLFVPLFVVFSRPSIRLLFGIPGRLAIVNSSVRKLQLAAIVTPIVLTVGFSLSMLYQQTTQTHAAKTAFANEIQADIFLQSTLGGFKPAAIDAVRSTPGVKAASAFITSEVTYASKEGAADEDRSDVTGISGTGLQAAGNIPITEGSLRELQGNTIALSAATAKRLGYRLDDTVKLRLADGLEASFRLIAIFESKPGYDNAYLPAETLVSHTSEKLFPVILVTANSDIHIADLQQELASRTDIQPGMVVADRQNFVASTSADQDIGALINYLLVGVLVGYTVITLINTLLVATAERRREFALQRLVGATRSQILKMVTAEAFIAASMGTVLATLILPFTLMPLSVAVSGSSWPSGSLWIYIIIVVSGYVLTLAATIIPTWFALRRKPIEEVASRE